MEEYGCYTLWMSPIIVPTSELSDQTSDPRMKGVTPHLHFFNFSELSAGKMTLPFSTVHLQAGYYYRGLQGLDPVVTPFATTLALPCHWLCANGHGYVQWVPPSQTHKLTPPSVTKSIDASFCQHTTMSPRVLGNDEILRELTTRVTRTRLTAVSLARCSRSFKEPALRNESRPSNPSL